MLAARTRLAQSLGAALPRTTTLARLGRVHLPALSTSSFLARRGFATTGAEEKTVPYTADKLTYLKRDPAFNQITEEHVAHLRTLLSPGSLLVGQSDNDNDLLPYNTDWMNKYRGKSQIVVRPRTTEEVSKVLAYCNEQRLAVVPQGGNTGLVGGSVPVFDEIVLSTNLLNKVRKFDPISGTLVCDAGCILESLENYLGDRGHIMPLDLGAKGSCHIGGNVATNAGGLRLLRYGSLHGTVLGLEVVLPDGTVLENLSTLRKDNTGYDLKQLFIGSEGTLGIITGVSILTPKKPNAVNVALVGLKSFEHVQQAFLGARENLSEILSAFECWDKSAAHLVQAHSVQGNRNPLAEEHPFYVLLETSGSNKEHDDEKLGAYLEKLMENEIIDDGVIAQDATQILNLWSLRESIPEACSKSGAVYKYDISMPLPVFYQMVEDVRARLTAAGVYGPEKMVTDVIGYGHVGDGNLHLNITAKKYDGEITKLIEPYVYEWAAKYSGSISAEHGLGLMKAPYVGYSKSGPMIDMMKRIKKVFDPHGIMNPYKFLPQ
ncbi:hypothetical protein K493DRAFT_280905 [Basidiobolus meristosporus CBS 931.73]|uniref:D-2-hydroxyglutarate dehydrogenase, mitochondrial n=1 Tax=Basidiobolus meristosporus CBS 931.73 TaxID=1314790 RepID=A0A1Y1YIF9_9FUNG|nr:hypothetical protein K493DRAFT_280905 [Basidiobolus meristosporus CBS 931.73]|eukprot:ORX97831.1 hypothetical protein K493DRAFT_280905 [Basidiobolus meristosporus CBS 931.73]